MAGRKQPLGECAYCGAASAKGGMGRHLAACLARRQVIEVAERAGSAPETLYHLRAEDRESPVFWLDLEVRGSATLEKVDAYLRAIWLECCGHLSRFSTGTWGSQDVGKRRTVAQAFGTGGTLAHEYDFGTTSYTLLRPMGTRVGAPTTRHPIALMARNRMPDARCGECGAPATHLCLECIYEEEGLPTLCEAHAAGHPHRDYEPVPLVNSPRLGLCGYTGPADPPY